MIFRFSQFELDEERRELREGGKLLSLQPLTFDMIVLLVRNNDRVVRKQELLDALWPDGFVAEGSLQRAISLARSALHDSGHEIIRTFSGRGYRFCAEVIEVDLASPGTGTSVLTSESRADERIANNIDAKGRKPEPRIRYARTGDGVSIAYWTLGTGPAFVMMGDAPSSHVRLEWDIPEMRSWYEEFAGERMVVRFDQRGGGLSDRDIGEFSLDAFQMDLEAVVDNLELEKFALYSYVDSSPVAIAYTARNPHRVSQLVLWLPYARGADFVALAQIKAVRALMDQDYELYMQTLAHLCLGWASGEPVRRWAEAMREGWPRDTLARIYSVVARYDVVEDLARVSTPTLVMHPRGLGWFPEDAARRVASGIPNARLAIVDGASIVPWVGEWRPIFDTIVEFLSESEGQ